MHAVVRNEREYSSEANRSRRVVCAVKGGCWVGYTVVVRRKCERNKREIVAVSVEEEEEEKEEEEEMVEWQTVAKNSVRENETYAGINRTTGQQANKSKVFFFCFFFSQNGRVTRLTHSFFSLILALSLSLPPCIFLHIYNHPFHFVSLGIRDFSHFLHHHKYGASIQLVFFQPLNDGAKKNSPSTAFYTVAKSFFLYPFLSYPL